MTFILSPIKIPHFFVIGILLFPLVISSKLPEYCKSLCEVCVAESVSCQKPGFKQIPTHITPTTNTFILLNQRFSNNFLSNENFSQISPPFVKLENLFIRRSNIRTIKSYTFDRMTLLRSLDLSFTADLLIESSAFSGLSLKLLKLDNNARMKMRNETFDGCKVESLHISHSTLTDIPFRLLKPILPWLKKLFLSNNNLKILDSKFQVSFKKLDKLNLQKNPFSCICSMKWLNEVYRYRSKMNKLIRDAFQDESEPSPMCNDPGYIHGEYIHNLSISQFNCDTPSLTQMKIDFQSPSETELTCSASHPIKQATMQVKWYKNIMSRIQIITNTIFNRYDSNGYKVTTTSDIIKIRRKNAVDSYDCVAKNINGNVTATVRISWPSITEQKKTPNNFNFNPSQSTIKTWKNQPTNQDNYLFKKRFTLLEMLGAVIGTFSLTLLLFFFLYKIMYLRRKVRRKSVMPPNGYTTYDAAAYSDSQTYDVPGNSYPQTVLLPMPHLSCSKPDHFLDFKTQKRFYKPT